jgi:hypothetical protein
MPTSMKNMFPSAEKVANADEKQAIAEKKVVIGHQKHA